MLLIALTVLGLIAFEVVSSIDNAVINAEVLGTIRDARVRRFFTTYGIAFAVFGVRGLLPLLIIYAVSPSVGMKGALLATFSSDVTARMAIESATPYLLTAGGVFLALLFLHWLLVEEKEFGLPHEAIFTRIGNIWFYAIAAVIVLAILITIHRVNNLSAPTQMLATAIGSTTFFIIAGFKEHAESAEREVRDGNNLSDWSKVIFLEIIDFAFSTDGVVGAFAFTTSVPLILVGNGVGAMIVRQLTLGNIERIRRYRYLKNGAMYSIGALACVMVLEGFGAHVPTWVSPTITISLVAFHIWLSMKENIKQERILSL